MTVSCKLPSYPVRGWGFSLVYRIKGTYKMLELELADDAVNSGAM